MKEPNVVIIHGSGLAPEDCWYEETKKMLERTGIEVILPAMPDNFRPKRSTWVSFLEEHPRIGENTIFTGHSSGASAAIGYAEIHPVGGLVLVAAHDKHHNIPSEIQSGFFDKPWNLDAIKANAGWIVQLASTNDPYIPIEESRRIKNKLGVADEDYVEKPRRHFDDIVCDEVGAAIMRKLGL